jgi:hypothetical protein
LSITRRTPSGQPSTVASGASSSNAKRVAAWRRPAAYTAASTTSPTSTVSRGSVSAASPRASACSPRAGARSLLLGGHLADERAALRDGEVLVARERVERRAQAGQRRAQLVAGVGGEAPRGQQRLLERVGRRAQPREHRVEVARERADLVGALVLGQRLARSPRR